MGSLQVVVIGPSDVIMHDIKIGGGKDQILHFDWTKFPQTPGQEFQATKIRLTYQLGTYKSKAEQNISFTGYGVFRISKFVTPNDDLWTGATETATLDGNATTVHTSWINRVRGAEGRGSTGGTIVGITGPGSMVGPTGHRHFQHPVDTQILNEQDEGAYAAILTVDFSLAKHESETRFSAHDKIVLSASPGHCFSIEDTGNWDDGNNHFDRFGGRVGPNDPDSDYGPSYVVKVPH